MVPTGIIGWHARSRLVAQLLVVSLLRAMAQSSTQCTDVYPAQNISCTQGRCWMVIRGCGNILLIRLHRTHSVYSVKGNLVYSIIKNQICSIRFVQFFQRNLTYPIGSLFRLFCSTSDVISPFSSTAAPYLTTLILPSILNWTKRPFLVYESLLSPANLQHMVYWRYIVYPLSVARGDLTTNSFRILHEKANILAKFYLYMPVTITHLVKLTLHKYA